MTTTSPTPDGPHLDDEAVSAALDGEAGPDEVAHLATCAACQAVSARFRRVQVAVGAPVAIDGEAREAALAAALAAFDTRSPAPDVRTGRRPTDALAGRRARRRVPLPPAWLGAAALVAVVALAIPLLAGGGSDDDGDTASETALDAPADDGGATATMAAAPPIDVGDLGALDPGADLRPIVDEALGPVSAERMEEEDSAGGGSAGGTVGGDAATGEAEAEAGDEEEEGNEADGAEASGSAEGSAPAPGSTGPEAAFEADGAGPATTCEPAVRAELPDAGALLLVGTATVDGADALVYGFAAPTERPTVLLAVVRADGCGLLTFQSYARG